MEGRPLEFMFDPLRFVNDENVRTMRPHELGAYAALFCNGWAQPEPGVFPDDDRFLAMQARMTPDEWAEVRERVALCFDLTTRPGFWVQKGTVRTAERRAEKIAAARASGEKGARSRWGAGAQARLELPPDVDGNGTPQAPPDGEPSAPLMTVGFGVVGKGREGKPQPRPPRAAARSAPDDGEDDPRVWATDFAAFWDSWPVGHKIDRGKCEALWARIRPRTREKLAEILAGLDRWKASAAWAKADPANGIGPGAFIPHPETWIRNARWEADAGPAAVTHSDGVGWARELENSRDKSSTWNSGGGR